MVKKVVIIGPESTGKSTLSQQLAQHYQTNWCREYAREYLLEHGAEYTFEDLETIARGQLQLEEQAINTAVQNNNRVVFIDTDMYVMKVWCEYVFSKCHQLILDNIVKRKYDLYLLCNIDLPWVADELREYPDEQPRIELYNIYKDILVNQQTTWIDISGSYQQRLFKAIEAVDALLAYPLKK